MIALWAQGDMTPLFVFVGFIFLVAAITIARLIAHQERGEALRALAEGLGGRFVPDVDTHSLPGFSRFKIFSQGRKPRASFGIDLRGKDKNFFVCDYRYTTGSGMSGKSNNSTMIHAQTILLGFTPKIDVPSCLVRPQSAVWDFLGGLFGGQDFNFEQDPDFSHGFILQGSDEDAVRELFGPSLRGFFSERRALDLQFEAAGSIFVLHRGRLLPEPEVRDLMKQGEILLQLLSKAG